MTTVLVVVTIFITIAFGVGVFLDKKMPMDDMACKQEADSIQLIFIAVIMLAISMGALLLLGFWFMITGLM